MRLNYQSEKGCVYGDRCNKKSKKKGGAKGTVALFQESAQMGCVSQDSDSRKSIQHEPRMLGSKHAVKFSKGLLAPNQNFGKERVHREVLSKSVNLMSVVRS